MDSLFVSTLIKLLIPTVVIVLVLFISKRRGISWQDGLGLQRPKPWILAGWLAIWLVWIAVSELAIRFFRLDQAQPWPDYPVLIVAIRILAIGLVGPFSEEIVMRGIILHVLRHTRVGIVGAIVLTAIGWAALHYDYGVGTLILIVADGLILGLARYKSGSLWVPVAMHVLGNLISIYQSLSM